ncbi:hypothetical protein BTVI_153080 [Pitangus sulphuratus]|nr:hypothetical protein BTVI_153080 [Pitangus sulphuratus]
MELLLENMSDRKKSPFIVIPLRLGNTKRKLLLYFANHLCSGMVYTCMQLMDNTELEKADTLLDGRIGHSSILASSFKMTTKNLMEFNRGRGKIPYLGCHNPSAGWEYRG